nr:MAG TPA: hypothetical protein [Caudoviricetes sp.]
MTPDFCLVHRIFAVLLNQQVDETHNRKLVCNRLDDRKHCHDADNRKRNVHLLTPPSRPWRRGNLCQGQGKSFSESLLLPSM